MRSHRFTKPYNLKNYKFGIVTLVGILSVLGILVVGSAKESLQSKQILGVIIGFTAMIVVSLIDYMWIMNFYWVLYALSIIMLAAVKLFGENVNGATRWIKVGFIQFQPSELAKILLIIFFAKFLMEHEEDINDKFTLIKYAVLAGIPLALILIEPNLSTTICTALMICLMIYIAGLSYKFIGTVLIILVPIAVIFLSIVVQPNQKILKDYQPVFDVIFMDIQMPVMNGYNAALTIRSQPRADARTIPIIAMTADAFAEDVKKARSSGMDEHIAKPLDIDKLVKVLQKWLS